MGDPVIHCATCDPTGRGRNCARLACYCGHPECWAFKTYRKPVRAPIKGYENTARIRESWNNREEPTWLDR